MNSSLAVFILITFLLAECRSFSMDKNVAFWNRKSCSVVRWRQPPSIHQGHTRSSLLFMSTFQEKTKKRDQKQKSNSYQVVFQKVVKPSSELPPILFLGYLVEYLQDIFTLPNNLPMVYEKQLPPEEEDENLDANTSRRDQDRAILWWDSPLTPNVDATTLSIEVVGIYSNDNQEAVSTAPDMAMVVVRKNNNPATKLPLMMKNLFEDSEKRIFRALDVGLEDFMAGRVSTQSKDQAEKEKKAAKIPNVRTLEEALRAELLEEDDDDKTKAEKPPHPRNENVVIDTVATSVQQSPPKPTRQEQSSNSPAVTEDYAVRAAKKAAVMRSMKKPPPTPTVPDSVEDFAVRAARERAQQQMPSIDGQSSMKRKESLEASSQSTAEQLSSSMLGSERRLNVVYQDETSSDPTKDEDVVTLPKESIPQGINKNDTKQSSNKIPSQQQLEVDIAEAARQALTEMAELGTDMSAEEMLEDVLKFGEQKEKENKEGSGFVSGAMEKAKELLRERSRQREERLEARGFKEINTATNPFQMDMNEMNNADDNSKPKKLTAEEELRQMFEAGERLADGRISLSTTVVSGLAESERRTNDEIVDGLIADETAISQYARVLDDELAELEVRINKSPGEESDGPRQNAIFDVFSGPEVYNPNVDPESAVNWPGALPGTKDVRLPRELQEAVQQAKFAVDVLSKLTETTDDDGESTFRLGEKEVSREQVNRLQSVANEAVQMGLIPNPLERIADRSRLDIVVHEMWDQPEERFREIASNYKDLLLSENFVGLVKERLANMAQRDLDALRRDDVSSVASAHQRERDILGHLVGYAQLLLKEARALGAELEAQQLEVIRSICKVAMDPTLVTEEETAMALTDAVREMRPLFDDAFVAYLKYAVAEEEGRLARAGVLDDPDHNQWLFVLKIVQQGVYTEIARGINRYIEHIW